MQAPADFHSVCLDGIMSDWLSSLRKHSAEALLVLGPNPFAGPENWLVLAHSFQSVVRTAFPLTTGRNAGVQRARHPLSPGQCHGPVPG